MVELGTYGELLASSSSFRCLLDNIHQQEQEQVERPYGIQRGLSTKYITLSENENDDASLLSSQSFETKETGSVKCHVYIAYLRAGLNLILAVLLLILFFAVREGTSVFYSWWLAKWSDDESHRHQHLNNCTEVVNQKINMIRSMSDTEWNNYRNSQFYFYCGK
jgi:hypothetical protein